MVIRICQVLPVVYLVVLSFFCSPLFAGSYKVLVVMSYSDQNPWCKEIRQGIEAAFDKNDEIRFFYMDTKRNPAGGEEKARQAYELYRDFQPDGVITADDNAQSMFVVPYLKNKVSTPVVFCGVNAKPESYGYPASNVTGVVERLHIRESLTFAQQLLPDIKRIGYMQKDSPSGRLIVEQSKEEMASYPVQSFEVRLSANLAEARKIAEEFGETTDAIFFDNLEGLPDDQGTSHGDRELLPLMAQISGKPIISNNLYHVEYGSLCAVIKSGQEQGGVVAKMLLRAFEGTSVADIPIQENLKGQPIINISVLEALGITPKPVVLKGVKMLRNNPKPKLLVVMSYEEDFPWSVEVREGIDSVLGASVDVHYFYMDTKIDFKSGPDKAREAYDLYLGLGPIGVIAVDDNAQAMFVVPYLKDKVDTPVIFCGVNAVPEKYGYPANNVSGVLERGHIKESIAFIKELTPEASRISYMARESPTGRAVLEQAERESSTYLMESTAYYLPATLEEAVRMAKEAREISDVMFLATMQGVVDGAGNPFSEKVVIPQISNAYGKPIITDNAYDMKYGMLGAVAVSGKEQGVKAAKMIQKTLRGVSVKSLPITRNNQGHRLLNVSALKSLGITPRSESLLGVELIKTEE